MISEVYNCDCMKYMETIPDKYFDLVIADPPYSDPNKDKIGRGKSVCRIGGQWAKKYGEKIKVWDVSPSEDFFKQLFRISKNQIIWGGNYYNLPPTRCFVVWRKLTISDKFSMAMAEYAWTSFQSNAKVFEFAPQGNKDRFHPTQKPVMLYKWLLEHYAKKGDKIFDPMMGSGSSRIAAYSMGYDYYGCELDKDYFEAADKRFQKECNGIYYTPKGIVKQLSLF